MMIIEAIETAKTNHVVYFLLAAYVETLGFYDSSRSGLPARVKNLPVRGRADVRERLRALRGLVANSTDCPRDVRRVVDEAVVVFATAASRLSALERPQQCHEPVKDDSGRQSPGFGNGLVRTRVDLQVSKHQRASTTHQRGTAGPTD